MKHKDVVLESKIVKQKPKRKITIDNVKELLNELEILNILIEDINKDSAGFYVKQDPNRFATPIKEIIIPSNIKKKIFDYFNQQLQEEKDKLTKRITGE